MKLNKLFSKKRIIFLLLFSVLALIGYKLNFSVLVGAESQFFTLFQFFGPITGAFLGPVFGVVSVFVAELTNFLLIGKEFNLINFVRLLPMLFAAYYFGKYKGKLNLSVFVPLLCMAAFMLHPVGAKVWFFSLYWTIPLIAKLLPNNLFFRSLGATFTAHAIGGALWIWTVPMPAEAWLGLIPVVAFERALFAAGISISYVVFNTVLAKLESFVFAGDIINIDSHYVVSRKLFRFFTVKH